MTWIPTYSGCIIDFLEPDPVQINILDIARGLSAKCRWSGQTERHYSVAEHSVWVSMLVDPSIAFYALLHDAAEAYISDIPKPLKNLLTGIEEIERGLLSAIWTAFAVKPPGENVWKKIKEVDLRLMITERNQLIRSVSRAWPETQGVSPYMLELLCHDRDVAFTQFLNQFEQTYRWAKVA